MGLTGVIYAAIVVAWAVFLVPLALRRHDQTTRNRSIERFSSTMRVLSAGGRGASRRIVLTPPREVDRVVPPPSPGGAEPRGAAVVAPPPSRAALKAAAARRRRVLRVLAAVTLVTGAVSLLGVIPAWSCGLPLALIVVFLVLARRHVRVANESYWRRAADSRPESSNVVRRSAARIDASHGAARAAAPEAEAVGSNAAGSNAAGSSGSESSAAESNVQADVEGQVVAEGEDSDPADDEPTIPLTAEQLASAAAHLSEQRVVAISLSTADGGSLWDPLPITLPTYVDKSVVKRSVRRVNLGETGIRSPGRSTADGATAAQADADADAAKTPEAVAGQIVEADLTDESPRVANA